MGKRNKPTQTTRKQPQGETAKSNGGPPPTTHHSPPIQAPRKRPGLLAASIVLFVIWLVFLIMTALSG